ncbi:MAG: hypothetical protein IKT57_00880 [Clostridia bacterium]|nr:hypothetical protein [Clostridia bacterium]
MNAFANTLFSLLLSWVKGLLQSVYGMFSSGNVGSFFVWLGDHWLGTVAFICVAGAAADLLVWLLRWRPDLVWRTKLRRLFRSSGDMEARRFQKGYDEAVDMQQDVYAAWQPPQQTAPQADEWWDMPESVPAYDEVPENTFAQFVPVTERRRRSDRYQKTDRMRAFGKIKDRLREVQEDENTMLDGLPPVMDSRQAFYDPVFPQQENKKQ